MRVFSRRAIREFVRAHPDAFEPLDRWYRTSRKAEWKTLAEVRTDFGHADVVGKFTVFNMGGNKYRLITTIKYQWHTIYIRHIFTHSEYEKGAWKS